MWKALEQWKSEAGVREARMQQLRDDFERTITAEIPFASIIGREAPRLPHTSNVAFTGCDRQVLVMSLDLRGVACSTGSACASGSSEPSPVLQAMGLAPEMVNGSVRFSLGAFTTRREIADAAQKVIEVVRTNVRP
jgi:cysteine desulfurase